MTTIPDIDALIRECRFEATRSSGSGGQNVNKVSTKVILLFNVLESNVLDQEQKDIFLLKLHTRISKLSIFRISSGRERTQLANPSNNNPILVQNAASQSEFPARVRSVRQIFLPCTRVIDTRVFLFRFSR